MSYTLCPRCGRKALSIATRCPHCGDPFGTRHSYEAPRRSLRDTPAVLGVVALVLVYLGVDAVRRGQKPLEAGLSPPPATATAIPKRVAAAPAKKRVVPAPFQKPVEAAPTPMATDTAPIQEPVDTAPVPTPPGESPKPPELSVPVSSQSRFATADTGRAPPPERPVTLSAAAPHERVYTTIWANVREARRPMAPVVTVLEPGEPVLVDSLRGQWYRVVADGRKVGYVYRGLVDTAPPVARN